MTVKLTILSAFALISFTVLAQESGQKNESTDIIIQKIAEKALSGSPSIDAMKSRLAAARELVKPAGAWPDPMLSIGGSFMGLVPPGPSSYGIIEYSQTLPYPGKSGSRIAVAESEKAVKTAEIELVARDIVFNVTKSFADIYLIDKEIELLGISKEFIRMMSDTLSAKYTSGDSNMTELIKLQIELLRIDERLNEIGTDRLTIISGLEALLGSAESLKIPVVLKLPEIDDGFMDIYISPAKIADNSALILLKKAEVASSVKKADSAKFDQYPDFSFGVGAGVDGMKEPVLMLNFGVELPIWKSSKQTPIKKAADYEVAAARSELKSAELFFRAEFNSLAARWKNYNSQIKLYRTTIIPENYKAFESSRINYLAGIGNFAEVIENARLWLDAKIRLSKLESDRFVVYASIKKLTEPAYQKALEK
ncbi:MAG TPA: TolC family protein [bacterium]|nr:TolC family protein [bacterium]HPS29385.1 TolC family protein [bacterium]